MEEVQSKDLLAREILEDARKKAARILKSADDTVMGQNAEWEKKTKDSIDELEKKHKEHCEAASVRIMDKLPIDKRRIKIEKIENLLNTAVESWYKSLSRTQIINLLNKELDKRIASCKEFTDSAKKSISYSGLNKDEAETTVKNIGGTKTITQVSSAQKFPFIILETETVKITASIGEVVDMLLGEKRAELVQALVGNDFLGDEV